MPGAVLRAGDDFSVAGADHLERLMPGGVLRGAVEDENLAGAIVVAVALLRRRELERNVVVDGDTVM